MDNKNLCKLQSDFISTVSHELRTPLTSIRGFAETLISSRDKLSDEQQLKFLNIIKDQSNRLINLVENLLSASSAANAEQTFIFKPTNVFSNIEKIISLVKQNYPRKIINVNISENIEDIFVDEERFQQVLLNIIENACKYSYENTAVTIIAKPGDEKSIDILVSNEGETIESINYDKIFEKFSRLDSPMTRLTQGSGMGLYLAKNITEKMNGKITVISKNNVTIFTINFPLSTQESIAQSRLKVTKND